MDFPLESPDTMQSYDSDTTSEERPSSPTNTKIQAKFQMARPPPKSNSLLRLSPKLLLQIQQLLPNHRPLPVLEIWQPPLRKSKLTRGFPQRPKLGTRDIYATLNELYITNKQPEIQHSQEKDTQSYSIQEKDIIAAMCEPSTSHNPTLSSIHFRETKCIWKASPSSAGPEKGTCYRFIIRKEDNTTDPEQSRMIMQWEKRMLPANGNAASDTEQFVLMAIDRKARRKSRIATMTRAGFEISVRKSSILDHLRTCMVLTEPVSEGPADLDTWLYNLVLTLGVTVASREGWLS